MASFEEHGISERLSRKFKEQNWELGLLWGLLNLGLALIILLDIYNGLFSRYLTTISPLFWYLESGLIVVLLLNFVYDVAVYFRIRCLSPLTVSKSQQALLGIDTKRDRGFVDEPPPAPQTTSNKVITPRFDAANFFYSSTPRASPSPSALWSSSSLSHLPFNLNETSMMSTTSSSWDYIDGGGDFKSNHSSLITNSSPMKMEDVIADENSLSRFLRERGSGSEVMESSKEVSFGANTSSGMWNQSSTQNTLSPVKARYQLSTRSPKSSSSSAESDLLKLQDGVLVWSKIGVSADQLTSWIENLRKWLSKTIISRLVVEISTVNDLLRWQGTPDLQIGEASLHALKMRTKGQNIPSLMTLLQCLDLTANQEYLVLRLKDLERGGCMSELRWNSGGDYKGKPWGEHLPTDSAIIMHLFFTYLDIHSPLSFSFPEGRAVTSKHFVQTPEKLDTSNKDSLYIYQSSLNPPHYQLVVGETVYELQKGRNNMFSAILLFLYQVKVKEDGILKRVNLGPSGLNLLWVMND